MHFQWLHVVFQFNSWLWSTVFPSNPWQLQKHLWLGASASKRHGCSLKIWFIATKYHTWAKKKRKTRLRETSKQLWASQFSLLASALLPVVFWVLLLEVVLFSLGFFCQLVYSLFSCSGLEWAPAGPCLFPAWSRSRKKKKKKKKRKPSISASELLWRWIHECPNTLLRKWWESAWFFLHIRQGQGVISQGGCESPNFRKLNNNANKARAHPGRL